jgi:hypothetical protein
MAYTSANAVMQSLSSVPLGFMDGESSINVPLNRGENTVLVRVRNRSAELERNVYHDDHISGFRGGEVYEEERNKSKSDAFTMGKEMTPYTKQIKPTNIVLKFDNKSYLVPSHGPNGEPSPWVPVPEGLYDLYVGNYSRMNSKDPKIKNDEIALIQLRRGKADRDFVIRPGVSNPWAFLEFDYKIIEPTSIAVDALSVYADNIMAKPKQKKEGVRVKAAAKLLSFSIMPAEDVKHTILVGDHPELLGQFVRSKNGEPMCEAEVQEIGPNKVLYPHRQKWIDFRGEVRGGC